MELSGSGTWAKVDVKVEAEVDMENLKLAAKEHERDYFVWAIFCYERTNVQFQISKMNCSVNKIDYLCCLAVFCHVCQVLMWFWSGLHDPDRSKLSVFSQTVCSDDQWKWNGNGPEEKRESPPTWEATLVRAFNAVNFFIVFCLFVFLFKFCF